MTYLMLSLRSLIVVAALLLSAGMADARDAAFLDPSAAGAAAEEAVKIDPKPEIDVGETPLGVAKRTSVFFVNQTNVPVKIEKVVINGDSNVTAEATADDCMKQGQIAPQSRCSVEVSSTPTSPGTWSIDVLMTHNGAGRLTRAHLTGKTAGTANTEKSTGLSVNAKEVKPVDFGDVTVGDGKIVRTTLMINDSAEPITLYAIDVIEADNGLQKLDQGCAVNMELAPGASCPVTLLWLPKNNGPISTDLIIRHSGKMGFAVIPVRGSAKGGTAAASSEPKPSAIESSVPLPPSAMDLERAVTGAMPQVSASSLEEKHTDVVLHLIGTVGDRALILKPSGETVVASVGTEIDLGSKTAKLIAINPHAADISIGGTKKTLQLEAADSLIDKANQAQQSKQDSGSNLTHSMGVGR